MMVGATLAAMMVCALREAALMVAMRGTARTMWYMVRSLERVTVSFSCLKQAQRFIFIGLNFLIRLLAVLLDCAV